MKEPTASGTGAPSPVVVPGGGLISDPGPGVDEESRQELLARHERWQLALEGSDLAVWDWDVESGRVFYSSRWWTMLGYGPDEVGDGVAEWSSRVHPDDLSPTLAVLEAHLAGKTPRFQSEHRLRARDGSWRWILDRGQVFERGLDGRPRRVVGTHTDITSRKQAEAELVTQNETMRWLNAELTRNQMLLRIASRAARLGGWTIALPEWEVDWSEEACALLEQTSGQPVSVEQWLGCHVPSNRARMRDALTACARDGEAFDLEARVVTGRGRELVARVIGEAVRDSLGQIVAIEGAIQDLTATKAVERSLEESVRRFRQQADAMPLIVWSAEPDGTIDYSNRHFFEFTGVLEGLPAGSRWQPCLHPEDLGPCLEAWGECVREGKPYLMEFRLKAKGDGGYRWFRVQAEPVRDAAGRVTKWYGTGVDIHEAKELAGRSAQLADQLAGILGSITDAFFTVDRDWRFTFLNAEAERQLVPPGSSLLGRVLWEEFPEVVGTRTQRDYEHAVANGVTVRFEEFYPRLGRWLEVRAYPTGGGLSVFFTDITERKEAEEKLREQATLLDNAQDAILVRDLEHRIQYWNQGAERVYGWKAAEVLGRSIGETLYRDPAAFLAATEQVMSRGEWVGEIEQ